MYTLCGYTYETAHYIILYTWRNIRRVHVYVYCTGCIKYSKMSRFCRGNFFIIISAATSPASGGMYFKIEWYAVGPPWGRHEFLKHHSVPFGFPMRWYRNAPFVRTSYTVRVCCFCIRIYEYVCMYLYIYIYTE